MKSTKNCINDIRHSVNIVNLDLKSGTEKSLTYDFKGGKKKKVKIKIIKNKNERGIKNGWINIVVCYT